MSDDGERRMPAPMRFAYRELATPAMGWVVAGISFGLLAIVAALGPMDTLRTLTLVRRLAYFGLVALLEVPVIFAFGFFVLYVLRDRRLVYLAAALALMCAVVAVSGAALAMNLYGLFHAGALPRASFPGVYAFAVLISGVGTALAFYVLYLRTSRTAQRNGAVEDGPGGPPSGAQGSGEEAAVASAGGTRLEAPRAKPPDGSPAPQLRLPEEIGRDVVYVHVSGHYVEVVTTGGTAVVLMRLSDVARALEGQGMQTHRSYWAAYRHVVRLQSDGHRVVLHLTGGHRVPVSKSFRAAVRAYMTDREDDGAAPSARG